jgi:hypothetical protein
MFVDREALAKSELAESSVLLVIPALSSHRFFNVGRICCWLHQPIGSLNHHLTRPINRFSIIATGYSKR